MEAFDIRCKVFAPGSAACPTDDVAPIAVKGGGDDGVESSQFLENPIGRRWNRFRQGRRRRCRRSHQGDTVSSACEEDRRCTTRGASTQDHYVELAFGVAHEARLPPRMCGGMVRGSANQAGR